MVKKMKLENISNLEFNEELDKHEKYMSLCSSKERINRARSFTIGSAFGNITEIMMRGDDKYLWVTFNQNEIVEIIHQLASNIGCNLILQPRNDFASSNRWENDKEKIPLNTIINSIDPLNISFDGLPGSPGYQIYNPPGSNSSRGAPGGLGGGARLPVEEENIQKAEDKEINNV